MNILSALLITFVFVGCKEKQAKNDAMTEEVIEEATIGELPRASDKHFEQALQAYESGNKPEAITHINMGITELEKESADVTGINKVNLDLATDQLRNIAGKLDDNYDISIKGFKQAIANAEINITHSYLATEDVYVLTPKEKIKENALQNALEYNLNSLTAGTVKLEGDAKKEGEKLDAEGKKLKEEFQDWKKRVEEHSKRVEEHFKNHQPEYTNKDHVYAQ